MCESLFYSVRKAARILGILPGDVSQLCNNGTLTSVHQGNLRTVSRASVETYAAGLLKGQS